MSLGIEAIILAAGQGIRLAAELRTKPKGLIRLGELPIIEESILKLIDCGVESIILVTGYQSEDFKPLTARYPQITQIENPHFSESETLCSLCCARNYISSEQLLVIESDLIYEQRGLKVLLSEVEKNALLISSSTGNGDEVFVSSKEKRLTGISKSADMLKSIDGEFVGISKITRAAFESLYQWYFKGKNLRTKSAYDIEGYLEISTLHPFFCVKLEDLKWSEIDDITQYRNALNNVYPLVVKG